MFASPLLLVVGHLKELNRHYCFIKSMCVSPAVTGQNVSRAAAQFRCSTFERCTLQNIGSLI